MKKNISKSIILALLLLPLVTGCHDLVFSNILEDVVPEEATVSGSINSITRYTVGSGEYLVSYSQNGLIYKSKDDNHHGAWKVYKHLPFELHHYDYYDTKHYGQQIIKTAADSTNLYVVAVEYENHSSLGTNIPSICHIWAANIDDWESSSVSWTDLNPSGTYTTIYRDGNYYYSNFNVFCTNAPQKGHRRAYLRNGDSTLYLLNGTSLTTTSATKLPCESGGDGKIDSAIYFDGYYVLDAIAATTNETYSSGPTHFYFAPDKSSRVYFGQNASSVDSTSIDAGEAVSCLAITKNALLIGRANVEKSSASYGGIVKANATNYVPEGSLSAFTTNAAAQMPSSYMINTLLAVDSSQNETETAIYGSVIFRTIGTSSAVNYDNVGMWSYYPSRGNWNRE
jgi:hypothetical protein